MDSALVFLIVTAAVLFLARHLRGSAKGKKCSSCVCAKTKETKKRAQTADDTKTGNTGAGDKTDSGKSRSDGKQTTGPATKKNIPTVRVPNKVGNTPQSVKN